MTKNYMQRKYDFYQIRNISITDEETGKEKIFICSNQMLRDALKAALPDEESFKNYFPKDKFGESTTNNMYRGIYDSKTLEMFIEMMDYVNEIEHTNLSVETVGIKVDRELSEEELAEINHLLNKSQLNDQRKQMNSKIKEIICNLSDKTEEAKFFRFKSEIWKLYEKEYSECNKMALANAIDSYKLKKFIKEKSRFLKKVEKDEKYEFTLTIILEIAAAYRYEKIKER